MASRLVFDPLTALRAAPLVSSTCTLLYAWDQHFFLSMLNSPLPEIRYRSKPVLQPYFSLFFRRGLPIVLTFIIASTASAVANLRVQSDGLRAKGSFMWYVAGAALSAGHLAYVPWIAPSVRDVVEATEEDVNERLDGWLALNWLRMVTVDLGAWIAFGVAVAGTLRAE
ncbi:integral membrane protein [Colletotrichum musicola]|uniref:Integral membrane protein n=1 Tax=Colletotrichum musicola TaxID=2175873 RepID=A0A8H6K0E7_9PEZI|nr:integral membrane protein [Colletotrichum musicola]